MVFVLDGVMDGRRVRFPLDPGRCRIGRDSRNDLVLTEGTVSREHAEFTVSADRAELRDLGSRNGTTVDGQPVLDSTEVRIGQLIRFGRISFNLVDGSSLDWLTPSRLPVLSPAGSIAVRRIGAAMGPDGHATSHTEGLPAADSVAAIAQAGHLLVLPNTAIDAVEEICELAREVLPWTRAAVLVCDTPESRPVVFTVCGHGSSKAEPLLLNEEAWAVLARNHEPLLLAPADPAGAIREDHPGGPAAKQALLVPILARGRLAGCLYLETQERTISPAPACLGALRVFADLLSVRIIQSRLSLALREQKRLEQELSVAAGVQRKMLSNAWIDQGGYEALARQIPCYEVGGDLYDIGGLADGRIILALGDVSGTGMGAAMLMSNVVAALRALYDRSSDPSELATRLHRQLFRFTDPAQFVTLFLGVLDPVNDRLEYVNAGHCPPFLVAQGRSPERLASNGLPLGLFPDARYDTDMVGIPEGSLLFVFSDGVPDASRHGEFYGEDRLLDALRGSIDLPPQELVDRIIRDVRHFVHEQPLDDDVTLMVLRKGARA